MIRNFGGDEGGESADVAVVILGGGVDAEGLEAGGEFVLEFSERRSWRRCDGRTDDDLDIAAEGGGSVVSDAKGKDGQWEIALDGFMGDAGRTTFEREMTGSKRAGAFGEDGEDTAGGEELLASHHGFGVGGAAGVGLVFVPNDGDAGEEGASEEIFAQLGSNEEGGGREDGLINPAVDGPIAVKGDEERGAGEVRARGKDVDAREIKVGAQTRKELVPEVRHKLEFTM